MTELVLKISKNNGNEITSQIARLIALKFHPSCQEETPPHPSTVVLDNVLVIFPSHIEDAPLLQSFQFEDPSRNEDDRQSPWLFCIELIEAKKENESIHALYKNSSFAAVIHNADGTTDKFIHAKLNTRNVFDKKNAYDYDYDWNNRHHNENGPARITYDRLGNEVKWEWFIGDKHHRLDGPDILHKNGDYEWYKEGQRHRDTDDPQEVETNKGIKTLHYRKDNVHHRLVGPALIKKDKAGTILEERWYVHGRPVYGTDILKEILAVQDPTTEEAFNMAVEAYKSALLKVLDTQKERKGQKKRRRHSANPICDMRIKAQLIKNHIKVKGILTESKLREINLVVDSACTLTDI